jgi:hypothetical protein
MKKQQKKKEEHDPVVPASQEGSVQSVGGGPSGRDEDDRSGEGTARADASPAPEPARDAFVSSEVSDKTTVPGKDPRTRS